MSISKKLKRTEVKIVESTFDECSQKFYHGTKANLQQGDLIHPGFNSNYGKRKKAAYVYFTLRIIGEIIDWEGHLPDVLKAMKDHLKKMKLLGIEAIED